MNIMEKLRAVSPKKWLIIGIAVACVVLILLGCLFLIPGNGTKPNDDPVPPGETVTVTVKNRVDAPLVDVQVYVYEDSSLTELVTFAKTDAEGKVSVTTEGSHNVAVLKGTAPGYRVEDYYALESTETAIVLDTLAASADGALPTDVKYALGDPMMDFTFTDIDGVSYTASEVLKEKKALVLNFWYTTCDPCAMEFPYLQTAYDKYKDSIALVAVDTYGDTAEDVKAFRDAHKLTLPMAVGDTAWASLMNVMAYPTTVVIDRYGFLTYYHVGMVTEAEIFETLFAYYSAEEYTHTVTDDVTELVIEDPDTPADPDEEEEGTEGTKDSPIEIGGTLTFKAEVPAGKKRYYDVYKVGGTVLTIKSDTVSVEYDGTTYTPKNGKVSFPVNTDDVTIPIRLIIENTGDKDATYTVDFAYPGGTLSNPFELKMGNLTTEIEAGNSQGVVYEYKATANGTVTMYVTDVTKGVDYGFSLYNLNTYAIRNLGEDSTDGKVTIAVNKGDTLQVTVSVLPNEKNEYPAATIKSNLSFQSGATTTKPTQAAVTYKVTVKADGKVKSGVKLVFTAGSTKKTLTTDSKGVATLKVKENTCSVQLTVPKGYIADKLQYTLTAANSSTTIELEKEEELDTTIGDTPTDYSVTVVDGSGKAQKGVTVAFYSGSKKMGSAKTNSKGVATATLMDGTYTVKLSGTTLKYDEKAAFVSVSKPSIEILLAKECGTAKEKITCPVLNKTRAAYVVEEGATYVTLTPGERNYFLFTPDRSGTFRISATSSYAKIGYYGGSIHYIQTSNLASDLENNAFTASVKDVGPTFVLGVDAATNTSATVLCITRVGDAAWSIDDEPWVTYEGSHTPKAYTLPSGTKLTAFDLTKTYKLVYNSSDGYYHKDSKTGPIVYLRFGESAPYVSFAQILANFHIGAYLYDSAGNFVKKEEYTECMSAYNSCVDATETVYPLTKDLEYIIKQYGKHQGWWDPNSPGYLFKDEDGNPISGIDLDTAWMFALCYAS